MKTIDVSYGQTIFDLSILVYGSPDFMYKLIQENPFIDSVNYNFDANPNKKIVYDEAFVIPKSELSQTITPTSTEGNIFSTDGQNIFDLCIQAGQPLENLYEFMQNNNVSGTQANDLTGRVFTFNKEKIKDVLFYKNIVSNKTQINTGSFATGSNNYRITEDGILRLTETLELRITE